MQGFTPEDLKRIVEIKNVTADVRKTVNSIGKEFKTAGELAAEVSKEFSDINSSANQFAKIQEEASKSSSATLKAIKEQSKQQNVVKTLNIQIDNLYNRSLKSNQQTSKVLLRQAGALSVARDNAQSLADSFGDLAESSAEVDNNTVFFSSLSEFVKDIPGLRKLSGPFEDAARASRETVLSNAAAVAKSGSLAKTQNAGVAGLKAGFKSLGPIVKNVLKPLAIFNALASIAKFFFDAMVGASKATADMSRNMLVSREAAREMYTTTIPGIVKEFNSAAIAAGNVTITLAAYEKALASINNELGLQLNLSEDFGRQTAMNVGEVARMTENFGYSAKASKELFFEAVKTGKPLEQINKDIFGTVGSLAAATGIVPDFAKLLDEAAGVTGNLKANFGGSVAEISKAVFQAKLLGLNLSQTEGISSSLLDFQSSIEDEMAAELLLGRQLNLEKAREAALMGDTETLMKEISKQAGSQKDFLALNIIQRKSLAKAVGMEVNELADMFDKQAKMDALRSKNLEKQNLLKKAGLKLQYDENGAIISGLQEIRLAAESAGKSEFEIRKILGEQIYLRKQEEDATQRFNKALEQAKDIFVRLVEGDSLDRLADFITGLSESFLFGGIVKAGAAKNAVNANAADDFIMRPGQPIQKFRKDDIVIGGTSLGGGSNNEVVILLRELISAVKQGGDVYIDGAKAGKSLALATSRMG